MIKSIFALITALALASFAMADTAETAEIGRAHV